MDFREDQYDKPTRLQVALSIAAGLIVAALVLLAGCAGRGPFDGVCAVQHLGENESGVQFVRYHCEPRE